MNLKKVIPFLLLAITYCMPTYAQYGGMGGYHGSSMGNRYNEFNYIQSYLRKKENGDNVDFYYRGQEGFIFGIINADYYLDYSFTDGNAPDGTQYSFTGDLKKKVRGMAYGFSNEHYFPLSKGEKSLMAFTFGAEILYIKFKFEETRLSGGYKFTPEHNILQSNIPIGFAYKSGTDAVLRSNVKSGFSFGGGALFNANFDLSPSGGFPAVNLRPYAMMEMSFYTGFCWKIRGTTHLGNAVLSHGAEYTGGGGSNEETTMIITSKPSFFISFIFTDFSWDWEEY